jgi:hypothetical protein
MTYRKVIKCDVFNFQIACQEVQLSIFVQLIQILFEYMHPIVSGKCLSNKNVKNGLLKSIKGEFKMLDSPLPVGI